jgi:HD-like signal output (HDOD) protein
MSLVSAAHPGSPVAQPVTAAEVAAAAKALGTHAEGASVAQLIALLYDDAVDVDEVIRRLNAEPALVARILKVANSPFYRRSGTVGTLERAVQVLGLTAIRGIAAAGCMDRLPVQTPGSVLDPARLQRHSLGVAAAAQALSQRAGVGMDGEAFMAGLLHDLGFVLLALLRPQQLAALAHPASATDTFSSAHERVHLGADHGQCAALLAASWGLPPWLAQALEGHHAAPPLTPVSGTDALPSLLALAEQACCDAGIELWPSHRPGPDAGCAQALGLSPEDLDEVATSLPDAVQRLSMST